jgi:hypothetical protein
MMVLDGRQEPFSAGGSMAEIAQIMLDAGCVHAINLDGGGSTTYLSKPEGGDNLTLVNRPSDGYARSVSTSLVAVSTAKSSKEFDHTIISSDFDHLTVGTGIALKATGVSITGYAAEIPEGAYWSVTDSSVGDVDGDGTITNRDALILLYAINDKYNMTAEEFARADLNGDGELWAAEALRILQYVSGAVGSVMIPE